MDKNKSKKVDVFFSFLVFLIMSYIDILTLNNILFGEGIIYDVIKISILLLMSILLVASRRRLLVVKKDALIVFITIILLFIFTLLSSEKTTEVVIAEKLFRGVFLAILGYILIRSVKNFDVFFKVMALFSAIIILYGGVIVCFAEINKAYMGFAYAILIYVLFMNYNWLIRGSKISAIFGVLGIIIELIGGARGAIICMSFLLAVCFAKKVKKKRNLVFVILFLFFIPWIQPLCILINSSFTNLGIDSRTISAIQGTGLESIAYANGRIEIFEASFELIKDNPFGYGFLGERAPLNDKIWWFNTNGYAHNIFVEFVLQFGVVIGIAMGVALLFFIVRIILIGNFELPYNGLFLIFLSYNLSLLVSRSYTTSFQFWVMLGLMFMIIKYERYKRIMRIREHTINQ